MTSSRSFFSRGTVILLIGLSNLAGCAPSRTVFAGDAAAAAGSAVVAVLPVDNLSGGTAPLKVLRQELIDRLKENGTTVLPDAELDTFMSRHRVRYVGGVDRGTSEAFRSETGASAVLVTSLELYNESFPPRIALTARLVATGGDPRIIRMESTAMAGDDRPGILGLGLVRDPRVLRAKAVNRLADALTGRDAGTGEGTTMRPESLYRSRVLDPARRYSVAVMPFHNTSDRKHAGEILALHFIRELTRFGMFDVIEPGVVRDDLLRYRIIMEDGVSMADAEVMFKMLQADFLLSGNVNDFEDRQGSSGAPKVDFSAQLLEQKSRKVAWGMDSRHTGDDRTWFFDVGKVNTASGLAAATVRGAIESFGK